VSGKSAAPAALESPAKPEQRQLTGYARATEGTAEALAERKSSLREAGCGTVYADEAADRKTPGRKTPGRKAADRKAADLTASQPRLRECLESLGAGDVLVVTGLDQLGGSQRELAGAVGEIRRRGAGLRSLREDLDTTAPGGDAIFRVFAGLADLGRAAISAGTSDGLAAARAAGKRLGRPPVLTPQQLTEVGDLLRRPENTLSGVARSLGVSRSTLYKYLPDVMHAGVPTRPAASEPGKSAAATTGRSAAATTGQSAASAHLAPYQARPGRRVLVIDDLADLRGPVDGRAALPLRLFWSVPGHQFDLADPDARLWYYQTVLREASRADDLTRHLDAATLISLWPELYLPRGVRRAWEERHHELLAPVSA
jgi:DNA invertase Pin-like site-specific DNA recombinase